MNMQMAMSVPGFDVIQKLFLSLGLDPTHLSSLAHSYKILTIRKTNKEYHLMQ